MSSHRACDPVIGQELPRNYILEQLLQKLPHLEGFPKRDCTFVIKFVSVMLAGEVVRKHPIKPRFSGIFVFDADQTAIEAEPNEEVDDDERHSYVVTSPSDSATSHSNPITQRRLTLAPHRLMPQKLFERRTLNCSDSCDHFNESGSFEG